MMIDVQFTFRYEDWIALISFRIRALCKKNLIMNLANNTCSLTLRNIEGDFLFSDISVSRESVHMQGGCDCT